VQQQPSNYHNHLQECQCIWKFWKILHLWHKFDQCLHKDNCLQYRYLYLTRIWMHNPSDLHCSLRYHNWLNNQRVTTRISPIDLCREQPIQIPKSQWLRKPNSFHKILDFWWLRLRSWFSNQRFQVRHPWQRRRCYCEVFWRSIIPSVRQRIQPRTSPWKEFHPKCIHRFYGFQYNQDFSNKYGICKFILLWYMIFQTFCTKIRNVRLFNELW